MEDTKRSGNDILTEMYEAMERIGKGLEELGISESEDVWLAFHSLDGQLGDLVP